MMDFQKAQRRHATVKMVAQAFPKAGIADGGEQIWNAIAGLPTLDDQGNPVALTGLPEQVALMMPGAALPVVRALSHVAAAYAFACIAKAFVEAQIKQNATNQATPDEEIAKAGWDEFEARQKLAHQFQQHMGCGHGPSWEMSIDVAQLPSNEVRQVVRIAEMAGRMYEALQAGHTVEVEGVGEVRNVTQGDDLSQVLASEVTQLFEPGLDDHAAVKLMEKQMLEYQQMATVPATRGPLVILSDESGSMGVGNGDRLVWSKAACVAMARIAHAGGRMVHVVHYADSTAVTVLAPDDHRAMLNMMRHFMDGGTSIGHALGVGVDQCGDLEAQGHVGADLVLVTDGEDDDEESMTAALDRAAAQGIELYTVAIQTRIDPSSPIIARAKVSVEVGDVNGMGAGGTAAVVPQDWVAAMRDATKNFVLPPKGAPN